MQGNLSHFLSFSFSTSFFLFISLSLCYISEFKILTWNQTKWGLSLKMYPPSLRCCSAWIILVKKVICSHELFSPTSYIYIYIYIYKNLNKFLLFSNRWRFQNCVRVLSAIKKCYKYTWNWGNVISPRCKQLSFS